MALSWSLASAFPCLIFSSINALHGHFPAASDLRIFNNPLDARSLGCDVIVPIGFLPSVTHARTLLPPDRAEATTEKLRAGGVVSLVLARRFRVDPLFRSSFFVVAPLSTTVCIHRAFGKLTTIPFLRGRTELGPYSSCEGVNNPVVSPRTSRGLCSLKTSTPAVASSSLRRRQASKRTCLAAPSCEPRTVPRFSAPVYMCVLGLMHSASVSFRVLACPAEVHGGREEIVKLSLETSRAIAVLLWKFYFYPRDKREAGDSARCCRALRQAATRRSANPGVVLLLCGGSVYVSAYDAI